MLNVMNEKKHIILDDVETWPSEVQPFLNSTKITKDNQRAVAEGVHALVKDCTVSGFHCTRLTQAEQAVVLTSRRIYPLVPEHALTRIEDRVMAGDFAEEVGNALKQNSAAARKGRKGLFHFLLEREVPESFYHFFDIGAVRPFTCRSSRRMARWSEPYMRLVSHAS
jgi:hypothetical protein